MSWHPRSTCGPPCLPTAGSTPTVDIVRRAARLAGLALTMAVSVGFACAMPLLPRRARAGGLRWCARLALAALGVRLRVHGRAALGRGVLVVANHLSWLDVVALLAVRPARLLAKREVAAWPLVGALADRLGTIFIDRARLRELPNTVADIADALRRRRDVAVFPEGSTWCGRHTGAWRPAAFQAALDAGAPVQPVRLAYLVASDATTAPTFLGDETLWTSLRRVVATRGLTVRVDMEPALHPAAVAGLSRVAARRALAALAAPRAPRFAPRPRTRRLEARLSVRPDERAASVPLRR